MWNPEKIILFVLIFSMAIMTGLTSYWIDWSVFENKELILREIQLPLTFFGLSIYFMIPYIKKLKEDNN